MISHDPAFDLLLANACEPEGSSAMNQHWRELFFAHAAADPERIAKSLPKGLHLQTYSGMAWVGFVAFKMQQVRFTNWRRHYPQPNFLETNLRTYVTHEQHGPGIWFFSLDADSYLPCLVARKTFALPYCYAGLAAEDGNYYGTRADRQRLPKVYEYPAREFRYTAKLGLEGIAQPTEPESFDFWLLERYRLYTADKRGNLTTAQVCHTPYEVFEPDVREFSVETSDPRFGNLNFDHFRFCPGVDVRTYEPIQCK